MRNSPLLNGWCDQGTQKRVFPVTQEGRGSLEAHVFIHVLLRLLMKKTFYFCKLLQHEPQTPKPVSWRKLIRIQEQPSGPGRVTHEQWVPETHPSLASAEEAEGGGEREGLGQALPAWPLFSENNACYRQSVHPLWAPVILQIGRSAENHAGRLFSSRRPSGHCASPVMEQTKSVLAQRPQEPRAMAARLWPPFLLGCWKFLSPLWSVGSQPQEELVFQAVEKPCDLRGWNMV